MTLPFREGLYLHSLVQLIGLWTAEPSVHRIIQVPVLYSSYSFHFLRWHSSCESAHFLIASQALRSAYSSARQIWAQSWGHSWYCLSYWRARARTCFDEAVDQSERTLNSARNRSWVSYQLGLGAARRQRTCGGYSRAHCSTQGGTFVPVAIVWNCVLSQHGAHFTPISASLPLQITRSRWLDCARFALGLMLAGWRSLWQSLAWAVRYPSFPAEASCVYGGCAQFSDARPAAFAPGSGASAHKRCLVCLSLQGSRVMEAP